MLCYLNDTPHLKFYWRNFASCGPGSRKYLQKIFGRHAINSVAMEEAGLKWMYENQWRYWARIGENPPHAWSIGLRPGMRVLDIENSLCWCWRYVNDSQRKGWGSVADLGIPVYDEEKTEGCSMPAWCDEEKYRDTSSRARLLGDYEEEKGKLGQLKPEAVAVETVQVEVKIEQEAGGEEQIKVEGTEDVDADQGEGSGGGTTGRDTRKRLKAKSKAKPKIKVEKVEVQVEIYEVEKVVCRKGSRADRDGLFRVRWKGYPPEDDTWERASSLRDGALEVSGVWPLV